MGLLTSLDMALRIIGGVGCCGAAYVFWVLRIALSNCCDSSTARARLPERAFAGKVAWVTGASSGIGKELARQLVKLGAKVIISARREAALLEVAEELKPLVIPEVGDVRVLPVDLEDLDSLEGKAEKALGLFGHIDLLFNNGGYSSRVLARDIKGIEQDTKMLRVNLLSYIALTKALMPSMHERKSGHIINISSAAGKFGVVLRTLYCCAKHGLMGWFDAFRLEESAYKDSISVTNVCPGSVRTDVATNSVAEGGSRRGYSDPNIDAGLSVEFASDRILAATYCKLDEVWIAVPKELTALYINSYLPSVGKALLKNRSRDLIAGTMGQDFIKARPAYFG